jgi:predicted transcriptional regulator
MIGPRFLCYTILNPSVEDEKKSFDTIFSNQDRDSLEKEAREAVQSYLNTLTMRDIASAVKPLSPPTQDYLRIAARFVSRARGIVILQSASFRDESGNDITYYEPLETQIEQPWRAVQQLMELTKYLAFVCGKKEVGKDELEIIKQVVISSMPADRSQALRAIQAKGGAITAKELSEDIDRSNRTSRRMLDELSVLGILKKTKGSGRLANSYAVEDEFKDFICAEPTNPTVENMSDAEIESISGALIVRASRKSFPIVDSINKPNIVNG